MSSINNKIRYLLYANGYTYRSFSEKSGIPLSTMCNIGSGSTKKVSFEICEKVSEICNVPLDYFRDEVKIDEIPITSRR